MISGNASQLASSIEINRRDLLLGSDYEGLKSVLAPNIIYIHSNGAVDNFQTYIEKLKNRSLVYLELEYVDILGSLFDNTLIITGKMNAQLILGTENKRVNSIYMATWVQDAQNRWIMCAHQGAPRIIQSN